MKISGSKLENIDHIDFKDMPLDYKNNLIRHLS